MKEMELSPALNTSQRILRDELDTIKRKVDDTLVDEEILGKGAQALSNRLSANKKRSALSTRGVS